MATESPVATAQHPGRSLSGQVSSGSGVPRLRVGTLALVFPPRLRLAGLTLTDSLSSSAAGVFFPEQEPGLGSTPKKLTSTRACFGRWMNSSKLTARVTSPSWCLEQLPWHGYQSL